MGAAALVAIILLILLAINYYQKGAYTTEGNTTQCEYGQLCVTNNWQKVIAVSVDGIQVGLVNTGAKEYFTIKTGYREVIMYNPNASWLLARKEEKGYYQNCNETYNLTMD